MKKITILFILLPGVLALQAQSLEQGIQQMNYERYETAENTFHQVLQQDPNNSNAWYYLVKDYLLKDEPNKANDTIQLASGEVKNDAWYKVATGTILLQQGKKEDA